MHPHSPPAARPPPGPGPRSTGTPPAAPRLSAHLVAAVLALLPACRPIQEPLRVASHVWPGYETLFLARAEGWLPHARVRLVETASATPSLALLAAGQAEAAALTLDEVLRARTAGVALTVVLVLDLSAGADVLLVRPGIGSLAELAGRRVAAEHTALGALVLHEVLSAAGLTLADIDPVTLAPDGHEAAWAAGGLDAVVTYEPVASRLEARGARRLFDSRDLPDTVIDVLAVRRAALPRYRSAVKALIRGHFRARAHLHRNPQDAAFRMAVRLRVPGQQVLGLFRGLELPDLAANRALLAPGGRLELAAGRIAATLAEAGLLDGPADLGGLTDASLLPEGP